MATSTGKPHVTRTYAPLHFNDLGPGRFEDLVRQLAYAFRRWRYLDATGVGGSDEGTDIRGIEIVSATATDVDEPEADVEEPPMESFEREWRIQCKRHKVLGPAKAKAIAKELIPDETKPPYGSILVAPIDLSAKAIAAFRSEALARGCREAHVWGRASLEDRLFLVENEHLLFAYFGITPRLRQQSRLQDLRRAISIKRRLLSALQLTSIDLTHNSGSNLLVRNIDDDSYPDTELKDEELDGVLAVAPC